MNGIGYWFCVEAWYCRALAGVEWVPTDADLPGMWSTADFL